MKKLKFSLYIQVLQKKLQKVEKCGRSTTPAVHDSIKKARQRSQLDYVVDYIKKALKRSQLDYVVDYIQKSKFSFYNHPKLHAALIINEKKKKLNNYIFFMCLWFENIFFHYEVGKLTSDIVFIIINIITSVSLQSTLCPSDLKLFHNKSQVI